MKQISSFDLYFLVKELQNCENSRVQNFYGDKDIIFIELYNATFKNYFLKICLSKYIFIDKKKDTLGKVPSSFVMGLRKYLKNSFIRKIEQIDFQRVLVIEFGKKVDDKIEKLKIIIELFSKGNLILCDNNYKIINSFTRKDFKERSTKVREQYIFPKKKDNDLGLKVGKFIAINFGVGGKFSDEIIKRLKLNKDDEIDNKKLKLIEMCINNIKEEKVKPNLIYRDDKSFDFFPFDFISVLEKKNFEKTFNDCIKNYFNSFVEADEKDMELKKKKEKLEKIIQSLKTQKDQILKDSKKFYEFGNKILQNFYVIDKEIENLSLYSKDFGWEKAKKKISDKSIIKKINEKNNEIEIEIN